MYTVNQKSSLRQNELALPFYELNWSFIAEYCIEEAREELAVLRRTIDECGGQTLYEYMKQLIPEPRASYQPMGDLLEVVKNYTQPLLGETLANKVVHDIEVCPLVLTANHHGVAYFAQDFQGGIIFSLKRFASENALTTVPIFSCGTVPLNNLTYPFGMLLYGACSGELDARPNKLPIFPNKYKRRLVSVVNSVDENMIKRAQKRVDKLVCDNIISESLADAAHSILKEEYCDSSILNEVDYSRQAVVLNNRIWNRLFRDAGYVPEVVNLELEKISGALLEKDIMNSDSLISCIMFDAKLRENVFMELDGEKACWQTKKLLMRLHSDPLDKKEMQKSNGCGTMLFWGIDNLGRRVPLYLEAATNNRERLYGIDDRGNSWELNFSPESITEGLKLGKLLPSMFTSYLVVSLARGIVCAGGYFQCEYLPAMQRGIVAALKKTGGYDMMAKLVSNVSTNTYLSGMIAVMTKVDNDYLIPAGPIEILAAGGFNKKDIEKIQSLTVRDAHICALSDTIDDLPFWKAPTSRWKTYLAKDIARLLENKIIIK
jgi:hypothetical protein